MFLIQNINFVSKSKQFRVDFANNYYSCLALAIGTYCPFLSSQMLCPRFVDCPALSITASPTFFSFKEPNNLIFSYFPLLVHSHIFFRLSRLRSISFIFFTSPWIYSQHRQKLSHEYSPTSLPTLQKAVGYILYNNIYFF